MRKFIIKDMPNYARRGFIQTSMVTVLALKSGVLTKSYAAEKSDSCSGTSHFQQCGG